MVEIIQEHLMMMEETEGVERLPAIITEGWHTVNPDFEGYHFLPLGP